jgi:hypothetical protein
MIQLNLLPAVKLDYIKAQKTRRLVLSISSIVTLASIAIFILLFSVDLLQKHRITSLNDSIKSQIGTLQGKPNINKILTVQNQLSSLTSIQTTKPAVNDMFSYLNEVTPSNVNITNFEASFSANTLVITGTAKTLDDVNQYVDTLKLTTYTINSSPNSSKAFTNIVLNSFGTTDQSSTGFPASYTINLAFNPALFKITNDIALSIPNTTTTRLEQANPSDLFNGVPVTVKPTTTTGGN